MAVTRIVAGTAKGRTLRVPSKGTRPTSAKVREAVFSKLENWDLIRGGHVLDLFAGSGALGLEALSRGAASAVFVERSRSAMKVINENARALDFLDESQFVYGEAAQFLTTSQLGFDVVFVDPPYSWAQADLFGLLNGLIPLIEQHGIIVVERPSRDAKLQVPSALTLEDHRAWGDTAAWFLGPKTVST